jgi:aspartyl-tRNA(Asn)/glutamyl-tRNA(Gln) amidotransferase subunit B
MQEHGLSTALAAQIAYSAVLNQLFEKTVSGGFDAQLVANMLTSVLVGIVNDKGIVLKHDTLSTAHFMELMHMITNNTISKTVAKEVLEEMLNTGRSPKEIVQEKGLEQISDDGAISEICREAIKSNEKAVQDYLNGKERALSAMVGYVMAKTKGKANPAKVTEELKKLIN